MLRVEGLNVRYGPVSAVRGVDLSCAASTIVTLVGPNGAGKSTILGSIAGSLRGAKLSGSIELDGRSVVGLSPEQRVGAGIALVPEGRRIFTRLTVAENLQLAAYGAPDADERLEAAYGRFPQLQPLRQRFGGLLSGGEQQQLAIARALMTEPRLLLLDEPSLGLAPKIVEQVFQSIVELRAVGLAIVLVEQNVGRAAEIADQSYVLRNGRIEGTGVEGVDQELVRAYFGSTAPTDA
jgi:branched-chain amino acid transport system ATP-binding protein